MMHRVLVAAKVVALCASMVVATGCATCCHRGVKDVENTKIVEKAKDVEPRPADGRTQVGQDLMPTVYFDFDKYDIRANQQTRVEKSVEYMKANATVKVRIEGNCDERGTNEYNLSLGANRAQTVSDYLTGHGVAKERVTMLTRGEENPADMGKTEEAFAKNRRDEFFYTAR